MVENCRELSLELMSFDVAPQQDLYTMQGVAVTVEAVAQIKVKSDPESIQTAAEQFLTKSDQNREALIRLVMEGHLRGIIGQLTVEQIVKEPEMVGDRMRNTCAADMNKMGLEVISFTIKEVRDKNEYIANMGRPDIARIKRDADVATAEAERDTAIRRAQARSAKPPSPKPRPIRSACWRRRFRWRSSPKRSATSTSRRPNTSKPSSASRRRPTRRTRSRPTSCSSR
jgi:flotillin